jgi:hypothetical protein
MTNFFDWIGSFDKRAGFKDLLILFAILLAFVAVVILSGCKPTIIMADNDCRCQPSDYSYIALMDIDPMDYVEQRLLDIKIDALFCLVQDELISFERFKEILFDIELRLYENAICPIILDILDYLDYAGSREDYDTIETLLAKRNQRINNKTAQAWKE